jgi:hypothetical protein
VEEERGSTQERQQILLQTAEIYVAVNGLSRYWQCCGAAAKSRGAEIKLPPEAEPEEPKLRIAAPAPAPFYIIIIKDLKKYYKTWLLMKFL